MPDSHGLPPLQKQNRPVAQRHKVTAYVGVSHKHCSSLTDVCEVGRIENSCQRAETYMVTVLWIRGWSKRLLSVRENFLSYGASELELALASVFNLRHLFSELFRQIP